MYTIEQQLELEKEMVSRGEQQYLRQKQAAEEAGRGADTAYARRLTNEYMEPMVAELDALKGRSGPGMHGRAMAHIREVDSYKAMFITLRCVFNAFTALDAPVTIANDLGKRIEDEVRFTRFEQKHKEYYQEIINDFKNKRTKDYRYMHRVLTHSANAQEDGWNPWSVAERVDVGMRLLDVVLRTTDLLEKVNVTRKGKTHIILQPTAAALKWIMQFDDHAKLLHPDKAPCIIPPAEWTDMDQGGYYSPEMRARVPMVLTQGKHKRMLKDLIKSGHMQQVMDAVNGAQRVAWKVNTQVLDIVRMVWAKNLAIGMPASERLEPSPSPFPDMKKEDMTPQQLAQFVEWKRLAAETYTAERERQSQCFQVTRIIQVANEYRKYPKFWYVWTLDFRGRMYAATSGLSPQSSDLAKGMLMFAEGKTLGKRGVYWLKVHLANRFGFDKEDYDVRVAWVDERHEQFMAAAADPMGHIDVWSKADKPYQFLAALLEYKEMHDGRLVGNRLEDYVSYLPVGLDGSCNGLQHFSAMLRDPVGGAATNLVPALKPSDIYSEVAAVCLNKLKSQTALANELAPTFKEWVSFAETHGGGKLPRSVAKRPVMTMPYGSTRQSCTTYIYAAIVEKDKAHFTSCSSFHAAAALTPLLWNSIGEVVIAARQGMDWLQQCATAMSRKGLGITWRTKDGFVAYMHEKKLKGTQIHTQLMGTYRALVCDRTPELDRNRQRNGVAPNFVHSHDAAHLRATVLRANAAGIESLALIHDDYGTHAADTDVLHRLIRESFVAQYTEFDPIESFREWQQAALKTTPLPPPPAKGTLNIEDVLKSDFFFG